MGKRLTTSQFIERASLVHNNTYNYEKVVYEGMFKKVTIICNIHGEFLQTTSDHLAGNGCQQCAAVKRQDTTEARFGVKHAMQNVDVQQKARKTNLQKYGVDNPQKAGVVREKTKRTNLQKYGVEYTQQSPDIRAKVNATNMERYGNICSQGSAAVKAKSQATMLEKYGVDHNWKDKEVREKIKSTMLARYGVGYALQSPELLRKMIITNNEKYNCNFIYGSTYLKSLITAKYQQLYNVNHPWQVETVRQKIQQTNLTRYGVSHAMQSEVIKDKYKRTMLERYGYDNSFKVPYIKEQIRIDNMRNYSVPYVTQKHMLAILPLLQDYNWLYDQYIVQNKTTTAIAEEFNICSTTVLNYLNNHEIAVKGLTQFSYKCICWLDSIMEIGGIYIQHALNGGEFNIPSTRYKADGYCKETNTIYEFHGDCWHGNPDVFESHEICNPFSELTAGELYHNTLIREKDIIDLGYNLEVLWESNF